MPTTLTLGRDPAADIIIGDPSISRRHAELVLLDDRRIFIRDLGGANGTVRIRAGQRLTVQREIVAPGDEVSFGDVVLSFDALKEMMLEKLGRTPAAGTPADADGARDAVGNEGPRDRANVAGPPQLPEGGADRGGLRDGVGPNDGPDSVPGLRVFVPTMGGGIRRLHERGLLVPTLVFAIFVSRLSWLLSQHENPEAMVSFVVEFSLALVFVAFMVVYRLCGKMKPWMVVGGVMLAEAVIMACHPLFDPPFCGATGAEPIIWQTMHAGEVFTVEGEDAPGASKQPPPASTPGGGSPKQADGTIATVTIPAGVHIIPGVPVEEPGFLARLWAFLTCAGLREELEKMLPVFGLIWAASRSRRGDATRWGVFEPLDAIVYACAAASAFIVIETFSGHGYVGKHIESAREILDEAHRNRALSATAINIFPLAILRTIDALTGHLAYSGYFAYFVGLGLLRPRYRERLWLGGWLGAALIHGFFDAVSGDKGLIAPTLATFVGFFFLMAAIIQARKLSPTREENFATRALPRERRA
jgi:RsiW-degrading membrane proteinase PrsW (M82 family)